MLLESLQFVVRIGRRVVVIQPRDHADVENVAGHTIDKSAAERLRGQRIAQRVNHRARFKAIVGKLPKLFDARGIDLRLASFVQSQARRGLFGQRAARTFAENDDARVNVGAGLVVRFRLAVVIESLIAGAHADDAVLVPEQLLAGKGGKDLRAGFLGLVAEPLGHFLQRRDVLTGVTQRRRHERRLDFSARSQKPQLVAGDRRLDGGTFAPIGQELVERAGIHYRTREPVISNLAALLDDQDLERAPGGLRQLSESNGSRQPRRTGAYD